MNFPETGTYHIYNRGNNQQKVFFNEGNYIYFLQKCHKYIKPFSEILAWCLMPNHFHFLVEISEKGLVPIQSGGYQCLQLQMDSGYYKVHTLKE